MFHKVNKFLISKLENFFLTTDNRNHKKQAKQFATTSLCILVLSFFTIWGTLNNTWNLSRNETLGLMILVFLILIGADNLGGSNPRFNFSNSLAWFIHCILPGKAARMREVNAFLGANAPLVLNETEDFDDSFVKSDKFKKFSPSSLSEWVKTFVGKEKSLVKLFEERVLGLKRERRGLLYWSQLLPLMDKVDDTRFLLLLNPIFEVSETLRSFPYITREEITKAFASYTSDDIKRLFSSAFALSDYLRVLEITKRYTLTLSVHVDMMELRSWAGEIEAGIKKEQYTFPTDAEWFNTLMTAECKLGKIEHIKNISELSYWASIMQNCIKSYKGRILQSKSFMFGILRDGEPYIVFELDKKGKIREAKKKANTPLSSEEDYYLQDFMKKIRNTK